jgi:hypothetical protein
MLLPPSFVLCAYQREMTIRRQQFVCMEFTYRSSVVTILHDALAVKLQCPSGPLHVAHTLITWHRQQYLTATPGAILQPSASHTTHIHTVLRCILTVPSCMASTPDACRWDRRWWLLVHKCLTPHLQLDALKPHFLPTVTCLAARVAASRRSERK